MAVINMSGAVAGALNEGSPLYNIMMAQDIVPGEQPSYMVCKEIYTSHPLGKKIIDSPISRAMNKRREIIVLEAPDAVVDAFNHAWDRMHCDFYVADCYRLSRIYGISSLAVMPADGIGTNEPLSPQELWKGDVKFNSLDPLNTAGSLVGILDPNRPDFLKYSRISVQGKPYAASRTHIQLYENPIYLSYTNAAYGYVGRSAFSRCLYPLQSYLQSMVADNLVMVKSGVLVAKISQPGSIIDRVQQAAQNIRLNILKGARTGNTVSIKPDEAIESLDLHYLDYQKQRMNILETIALSLDMPAQFMTSDALSQGFGEGEEDAKLISSYIDRVRLDMKNLYDFMDNIVMHVAWNPEYHAALKNRFPGVSDNYDEWFAQCKRSFKAIWPEALEPSKKERVEFQRISYESILQVFNALERVTHGENKGQLVEWVVSNLNEMETLFPNKLEIDVDDISERSELGLDENLGGINDAGVQQKSKSEVVTQPKPKAPRSIKGVKENVANK